jgi:hypothetical protein
MSDVIYNADCYFGLYQFNYTVSNNGLLHLVFANFSNVGVSDSTIDSVTPNNYHPFLITELSLLTAAPPHTPCLFCNYTHCDHARLFKIISSHDWSWVHEQSSADTAVNQLISSITDALNQAIP